MKWMLAMASLTASLLAGSDAEIAAYVRAFEESVQPGPADAEHFLVGRLGPDEKNSVKLQAHDISLPKTPKPPEVLHRRALILIPMGKLERLLPGVRDYSFQHKLYPGVLKYSSGCKEDNNVFAFRYWTTTSWKDTLTENEATHESSGPRYKVSSKLRGIRLVNGDDNAKSTGNPDLDLCQLPLIADRWQFQDIRTEWRFEETTAGVYVETNSLAVLQPSGMVGGLSAFLSGMKLGKIDPLRKALNDLNDEVLRAMARNP